MSIPLSRRETQVIKFLWDGLSIKETAATLILSQSTVYNYTERINQKLEAKTLIEACRKARQLGILDA